MNSMQFYAKIAILVIANLQGCSAPKDSWVVKGESMVPTLTPGDVVSVDTSADEIKDFNRWDIILFESPSDPGFYNAMRVVGFPGDLVSTRGNQLILNGQPVMEQWPFYSISNYPERQKFAETQPYEVPVDAVFVLGDNGSVSFDSRFYGAVPAQHIIGRIMH